ncbi:MAG: histidine kinase [Chitinophagaceae bacterium]|nr:histidine kinase [Chitinophagaceae bacterium]
MVLRLTSWLFCLLALTSVRGQDISFYHINTSKGLSDNFIRSLAIDKNGFLWTGTNEGLNSWDGYTVTNYSMDENPGIPGKTIVHMLCDKENNLWLGSWDGAGWADTKRRFHRIRLEDSITNFEAPLVEDIPEYGPVIYTNRGQYYSDKNREHWKKLEGIPAIYEFSRLVEVTPYEGNQLLVTTDSLVTVFDYAQMKVVYQRPFKDILSVCRISGRQLALADRKGMVFILDIGTNNIIRQFDLKPFVSNNIERTWWAEVRMAANGKILYASPTLGFFIIDPDGAITHYTHDPADPRTIASDRVYRLLGTPRGDVVVGTERYGISIFNILKKQAVYQKFFSNGKGQFFDGYVTEMALDKDGSFWMGAADRLIHWNPSTNLAQFYQHDGGDGFGRSANPEVLRVCIDHLGQIWTGVKGMGPALFNRTTGKFYPIPRDTARYAELKGNFYTRSFQAKDGRIWVAGDSGVYIIHPDSKTVSSLSNDPILGTISHSIPKSFTEDSRHRIWVSTWDRGLFCYDAAAHTLQQFTTRNGLLDDNCLDLFCSSKDEIYVTQTLGFSRILANGKAIAYSRANGLRYDKADAFIEDDRGNIWISNAKCLIRMDPVSGKMDIYDEHENLNKGGFKPSGVLKTPDGTLYWSTQSGINFFHPDELIRTAEPLQVSIYEVMAGDSLINSMQNAPVDIRYRNNNLQFNFVAISLSGSGNIRYQYKLEGYDKSWQEGTDIRQARYSSLPPGKYVFKVRASEDRNTWVESVNQFSFRIIAPLYLRTSFRIACILLVAGILFYVFRRRTLQLQKKKEELETEQAVNYFGSSLHEYHSVDEILWDVARNCIGRLGFEDCVIYLLDDQKQILVQKAAYGPKSPRNFEIRQPMDIPLGKGIVGTVAVTGEAELIADTSRDSRYIVDDVQRYSEISVPVIYNSKVLGVIDCEHSKKRFFTQKHLSILTTIASICANKIIRARAEEEKKQAEMILAETRQKMAEAEMQALRAQMNPHFIFNCLNSINRYIVKSDQATASLYLTRFAKLIRLILDNSNSKNVVLSNELEALRLYIEMESLRFDQKFTYTLKVEPDVQADTIEVPPLIIQPYIENAIWHGLLHRSEGGHLQITLGMASARMLKCVIEDNGVGREKAAALKSKSVTTKKSLGMELTESRLLLLSQYAEIRSSVVIEDLKDEKGEARGTRVTLNIPVVD